MSQFDNEVYRQSIEELINDTFYTKGLSYSGKIASIRKYTEIILRKLLDYPGDEFLTLGKNKVLKLLDKKGYTEALFRESLDYINQNGSDRTHSQKTDPATEEEYNKTLECLFNLYGYLFYKYFKRYPFGSNTDIERSFSLLPPIIRHITLTELYKDEPTNQIIIDKLLIVKTKVFDKETTFKWIQDNKSHLKEISGFFYDTMYDECVKKASVMCNYISEKGTLYRDFEEAVKYYNENGHVDGDSIEIKEFNSLMEFMFMGRKERKNEVEKPYIIFVLS